MIIRCPNCEHSRTVNLSLIPPTAELATCPKCRHRFRFRTLNTAFEEPSAPEPPRREPRPDPNPRTVANTPSGSHGLDIWDAVDALNQQWERQLEKNVTEVITPQPKTLPAEEASQDPDKAPEADAGKNAGQDDTRDAPPQGGLPDTAEKFTAGTEKPVSIVSVKSEDAPEVQEHAAADRTATERTATDNMTESPSAWRHAAGGGTAEQHTAERHISETAPQAAFPHAADDTTPEERVERDMHLLRAPENRPLRDLGRLDELGQEAHAEHDSADADADAVPWEAPEIHGWLKAFIKTVHEVMFNSPFFFSRLRPSSSLAPGYLFFLLLGYIAILGSAIWAKVAFFLLPGENAGGVSGLELPVLLLLAPVILGLMQLFVTGCIHILQQVFSPGQTEFSQIFRVVSYAVAPFVLSVVPFVGPVVGAVWFLASLFTGCRHALQLSWQLSIVVSLFPALMLLFGAVWYFL